MAISIDWGTKVISVLKDDLTLIQSTPTTIYNMDLNWFRLQLKDLEDSEDGMHFPITHNHNPEVSLGGLTYARVIEMINGYTITFEDGQYAINLVGANSNVADNVNVNQVSVRASNSAGLTSSPAVEYSSFSGGVTINALSTTTGTIYPAGTPLAPVNNLLDAVTIAQLRGFNKFFFIGNFTFIAGDYLVNYELHGQGKQSSTFTFEAGSIVAYCKAFNAKLTGSVLGITEMTDCHIYDYGASGLIPSSNTVIATKCMLEGTMSLPSNFTGKLIAVDCYSLADSDLALPILDMGGGEFTVNLRNHSGRVKFINSTRNRNDIRAFFVSGGLVLDSSDTDGNFIISGVGTLVDDSNGATVDATMAISTSAVLDTIQTSIGNEIEYASYESGVTIDSVNGTDSHEYPYGTPLHPCKTTTNSYMIRLERGFTSVYLRNDLTLVGIPDGILSNLDIVGMTGYRKHTLTISSVLATNCSASNVIVTGAFKIGSTAEANNCYINNADNVELKAKDCTIAGGTYQGTDLQKCVITGIIKVGAGKVFSGVNIVFDGDETVIDMQGEPCTVSLDIDSGYFLLKNAVDGCLAEFNCRGGEIELDASCTGGDFYAEGIGTLIGDPEALGMTVKGNYLISLETIPAPILDAMLIDHQLTGSVGKGISSASSAGDPWASILANYTDDATFGAFIKKLLTSRDFLLLK